MKLLKSAVVATTLALSLGFFFDYCRRLFGYGMYVQ